MSPPSSGVPSGYPAADAYGRAVQNPDRVFRVDDLRRAVFPLTGRGVPQRATGNNAVVFRAQVEGCDEAIRFFTRPEPTGPQRYASLSEALLSSALTDAVPPAQWIERGIEINGQGWPLLRMEWVSGMPLDEWVDELIRTQDDDAVSAALATLATSWRTLVARLQNADIAHGDLQHGNVLVDDHGAVRLVDLDGAWLPALEHLGAPGGRGHDHYQHPQAAPARWGRYMDTFPALVIHLSLSALRHERALWDEFYVEDNLVFRQEDFEDPGATPIWDAIAQIDDPGVRQQTELLRRACHDTWRPRPLDALLTPSPRTSAGDAPWWELVNRPKPPSSPPRDHGDATTAASERVAPPPRSTPPPGPDPKWHEKVASASAPANDGPDDSSDETPHTGDAGPGETTTAGTTAGTSKTTGTGAADRTASPESSRLETVVPVVLFILMALLLFVIPVVAELAR